MLIQYTEKWVAERKIFLYEVTKQTFLKEIVLLHV